MRDQKEEDQKVLAVPTRDPRYDEIHTIDQVFSHVRREIEHFFQIYKELQGTKTAISGWGGPKEARRAISDSRANYLAVKAAEVEAAARHAIDDHSQI
jgi:inorganic pyrophosphatase